ncbi:hypothetical protein LCGC14_2403380 [marine sediment metagenome]|uniref:Uncharacterized protein n=1 Tax=marine sediment metagenome TaxID=412755 RepID=A0A0F9BUT1_9ZZZZ
MKKLIISLLLLFLGGVYGVVSAGITERVIYAGDTPLFSDCNITQTGPMELTVAPCTFTTTGEAKIFNIFESIGARLGVGRLAKAITENRAEMMKDGMRVRGWLINKQGNIIERSVTWRLPTTKIIAVIPDETYFIYLVKKVGVTMGTALLPVSSPRPADYIHHLAFEFTVPLGTTNLSGIEIEVFTVKPNFAPAKGLFEK